MTEPNFPGLGPLPDDIDSALNARRRASRARVPSASREPPSPPDQQTEQVTGAITRRQVVFILVVNAVISGLISLCVVLLFRGPTPPASTPHAADIVTPATIPSSTPATEQDPDVTPTATDPLAVVSPQVGTQVMAEEASSTPEPILHVVQRGDTISGLAFKYNLPEEDIIIANQLKNPNLLQMGTELIIPVGGLPERPPTITPVSTATSTPIPFEPPSVDLTATVERVAVENVATTTPFPTRDPSAAQLQIEIAEIVRPGVLEAEGVFLINVGDERADLQGWILSDSNRNEYIFPNLRLWQGGSLMVYTREGTDDPPSSFFWGMTKAIWSLGEVATLRDAQGNVVTTFSVSP